MLYFYWDLGKDIIEKQAVKNWGNAVVEQLSKDLQNEFPEMKGFSRRNLFYMKSWYLLYNEQIVKVQQLVAQTQIPLKTNSTKKIQQLVGQIPWGHNMLIIQRLIDKDERIWYIKQTIENGWSRNVLDTWIDSEVNLATV